LAAVNEYDKSKGLESKGCIFVIKVVAELCKRIGLVVELADIRIAMLNLRRTSCNDGKQSVRETDKQTTDRQSKSEREREREIAATPAAP
jgi:hypothetical protein